MIELEPFGEADFERLIAWIDSPQTLKKWGQWRFTYPLDREQLQAYLAETRSDPPQRIAFRALLPERGKVVGHAELNDIDLDTGMATIGRVFIAPEQRGRGLCVDLVRALVAYAFTHFPLQRVDLMVYDFNGPALACYRRAGFTLEGILRRVKKVEDAYWNLAIMSILREEWAAREQQSTNYRTDKSELMRKTVSAGVEEAG